MPCFYPIPAYQSPSILVDGVRVPGTITLHKEPPNSVGFLRLPCGSCIGCRKAKARSWALRCHLENSQHEHSAFTTLTYDDRHLPVTLSVRHLQLFIKSARKKLGPKRPIRFFASGEYGTKNGRPHYHAVLFGVSQKDADLLHSVWKKGHTATFDATPATIGYTAGYTAKKLEDFWSASEERIDYTTGEIYTYQPPFFQMSRRPGIGGYARQWASSWRAVAVYNGQRMAVPRYLHEAWKATATPEQQEDLAHEKYQRSLGRDTSEYAMRASELIEEAKQRLQAARRKL